MVTGKVCLWIWAWWLRMVSSLPVLPDWLLFLIIENRIPLSIVFGAAIPVVHWIILRRYKTIFGWDVRKLVTPVVFTNASDTTAGTTSVIWSQIATGLWSQWYMRLRHPRWFGKYNYIVGGGLDAGAKVMMFILTFAVFGGSGKDVSFPIVSPIVFDRSILKL